MKESYFLTIFLIVIQTTGLFFNINASKNNLMLAHKSIDQLCNIDVIVNPANSWLSHGGGIAGALSDQAGPKLQETSNAIINKNGALPAGSVVVTDSYSLSERGIKKIIHAVGPDCRNQKENQARKILLKKTYENIFIEFEKTGYSSIAIPSISTGIFGYPDKDEAIAIALFAIKNALRKGIQITIFAHDNQTIERYQEALNKAQISFDQE